MATRTPTPPVCNGHIVSWSVLHLKVVHFEQAGVLDVVQVALHECIHVLCVIKDDYFLFTVGRIVLFV